MDLTGISLWSFGAITLITLIFSGLLIPVLWNGGTERLIAYPIIFWITGRGGYLLGESGFLQQGTFREQS